MCQPQLPELGSETPSPRVAWIIVSGLPTAADRQIAPVCKIGCFHDGFTTAHNIVRYGVTLSSNRLPLPQPAPTGGLG